MIQFTGERIVPEADNCEPRFAEKMYQEHLARYAFAAQWIQGKKVLDVGCGVGYGSKWMAQNGAESVLGFDLSIDAITHANEFYSHEKVTFKVASATDFFFEEKFDVVTCFELIEHVEAQSNVISCIRKVLKEDGVLIISTPRALEEKRVHFHTKEFSLEEFKDLLETYFPKVTLYFENNHFASLITDHKPVTVDQILPLKDNFTLSEADYFIAIASTSDLSLKISEIKPVLVLGDDEYVKLLERDVEILHRAEDRLNHEKSQKNLELEQLYKDRVEIQANGFKLNELIQETQIKNSRIEELLKKVGELSTEINTLSRSTLTSKVLKSLRVIKAKILKVKEKLRKLKNLIYKAFLYLRKNGAIAFLKKVNSKLKNSPTQTQIQNTEPHFFANKIFDVIFCIGCWEGESKRYRVYNIAEGLEDLGYRVQVMPYEHVSKIALENVKARTVILFRAPYDDAVNIKLFLTYAKDNNIKVIFDIDDLVFEPDIIDQIDGFKLLPESEQQIYIDGVNSYRKLLLASDLVTVTTDYLRERVESLDKPVTVIPNSINFDQQQIAFDIEKQKKPARDFVRIGYFSGSRTHQADFEKCAEAILKVMEVNDTLILRVVGFLDLDERWNKFSHRIERFEFLPYKTMLSVLSECDINIAPLDLNSVFCYGKSELKFFEAGLLEIPTIASATHAYKKVIEDGINGKLANDLDDWETALKEMVGSKSLRIAIGKKAKDTSLAKFAIQEVAILASNVYGLDNSPNLGEKKSYFDELRRINETLEPGKLRITWVVPELIIGGGGHRNILRAAYYLQKFGHQITLYFTGTEVNPKIIKQQIQQHFYPLDCPVLLFKGSIKPSDVVFATHWSTVNAALSAQDFAKEIIYFVQDFEPSFAPMGSEYVLAENTYRLGLYHITSGPWCEVILRRDFNALADHFQFPIDTSIYYPRDRKKTNPNLVFFAKPEMPRRCYELGVMALRELHTLRPDLEIVMFGSKNVVKESFDFPVTVREVLPTLDDLAQMYSDGDVGLVFSTTNPSLIPYEMMACGLPVIDLDRGDNVVNYSGRTDIALLANPLPKIMARQIADLLSNPTELKNRRENGLSFVNSFPSEEGMAKRIETLILKKMGIFESIV